MVEKDAIHTNSADDVPVSQFSVMHPPPVEAPLVVPHDVIELSTHCMGRQAQDGYACFSAGGDQVWANDPWSNTRHCLSKQSVASMPVTNDGWANWRGKYASHIDQYCSDQKLETEAGVKAVVGSIVAGSFSLAQWRTKRRCISRWATLVDCCMQIKELQHHNAFGVELILAQLEDRMSLEVTKRLLNMSFSRAQPEANKDRMAYSYSPQIEVNDIGKNTDYACEIQNSSHRKGDWRALPDECWSVIYSRFDCKLAPAVEDILTFSGAVASTAVYTDAGCTLRSTSLGCRDSDRAQSMRKVEVVEFNSNLQTIRIRGCGHLHHVQGWVPLRQDGEGIFEMCGIATNNNKTQTTTYIHIYIYI